MQYKTMTLGLLEANPALYAQLQAKGTLQEALDAYTLMLKTSHQSVIEHLRELMPDSDPSQLSSEGLEIALQELEDDLSSAWATSEGPILDEAMEYLRRHTPSA